MRWLRLFGYAALGTIGLVAFTRLLPEQGQQRLSAASSGDKCQSMGEASAYNAAKRAMEGELRAPASADFASMLDSRVYRVEGAPPGECRFVVRSYVDSQNAYGAKVRTYFEAEVKGQARGSFTATKLSANVR